MHPTIPSVRPPRILAAPIAVSILALTLAPFPGAAASGRPVPPGAGEPAPAKLQIWVDPAGDDGGPGDAARPLRSLERARDAIREARAKGSLPEGGAEVLVRGTVHPRGKTFELGREDSGAPGSPIIYRAAQGDEVRLLGGRPIGNFKPVEDPAILSRLAAEARGKVLQADLKAQGISDFGRFTSRGFGRPVRPAHLELFFQGKRMTVARYPNEGYVKIVRPASLDAGGDGHGGELGRLEAGFIYDGDRPGKWKGTGNIWVHGFWAWDWANSYEEVDSIDTAKRLILTKPPHGQYGFKKGQRYYYLNILEELDAPGEYCVDAASGILYFWPPAPMGPGEALVSVLEGPMVEMRDTSHVILEGLVFEASRGCGIRMGGGEGNSVRRSTLRNLGNWAIEVNGGKMHTVEGCRIYQIADGGVSFQGGDRATLTPSGHQGIDNHIHHLAEWSRCYYPAFLIGGVGTRIANNLIHDHPHCAILFGGNEHLIELNEIHHVCLDTGDVGAIYTGRDWTYRGNLIRHNFIHHTGGVGMGSMGVYLDDCVSGETVFGNVFYKVQRAAFIGGGRDNRVENNIFVDCSPAVSIDGRGLDKSPVWHNMVYDFMRKRLAEVRPQEPPYSERYPKLREMDAYYARDEGVPPEGNVVVRNICVGTWTEIYWHAKPEMIRMADNLLDQDPGFVDAASLDFRLREDSPAWKMGFEKIPFERIGLVSGRPPAAPGR